MNFILRGKGLRALPHMVVAAVVALSAAGCDTDKIVEVQDPAALRPEDLNNLGSVPALVTGALRQFVGGYSGFGLDDAFLSASGVISDEFYYGDTFTTRSAADRRIMQPAVLGNISDAAYGRLHQARFNARRAFGVVDEFTTAATATADANSKAQLRSIEGYVYVTLSEGWCGAVPFSKVADTGPIDPIKGIEFGAPLGTVAMNDTAVTRFNEALALNAGNSLAAVGKGRALLNAGKFAEASAAVAAVPTTFVFLIEHSVNVAAENNPMYSLSNNGRYGVSNLEGGLVGTAAIRPDDVNPAVTAPSAEGIAFRGLRDPRVPWEAKTPNPNCFTASVRCWLNSNYPNQDADLPLASGVEARLIEAEAALRAGQTDVMLARLNTLRASAVNLIGRLYPNQRTGFVSTICGATPCALPALVDPAVAGTPAADQAAARRNLLFQERALWLFNTGHRQGDLRRLVRNYGLTSSQAFPSGPHFRTGVYGNDVAYPVPFAEEGNNPLYNSSACILTQA